MQYTLCMYANISIYIYIYTAKCLLKLGYPKPLVSSKALVQFWTILGPPLKNKHGSSINLSRVFCMDRGSGTAVRYSLVNEYRLI